MNLRFSSFCSGIESASVAFNPLGWKCQSVCEIEKFACALLKHHYPDVPNIGDMNIVKDEDIARLTGSTDVMVAGTPCQSFSIAGLRGGLADARGNLALRFFQLVGSIQPRWVLWENVPGVLSSNRGRDFGSILGALAELGYGFAYRILDAQYVRVESHRRAVPQVRRRVFVVGYLGDWRRAAAVLFERESLCRNTPPRKTTEKDVAATLTSGTGASGAPSGRRREDDVNLVCGTLPSRSTAGGGMGTDFECSGGLVPVSARLNAGGMGRIDYETETFIPMSPTGVRRLTPLECERLQGFNDNYTAIPYRNGTAKDCPRYRAIGNSMAVNVMSWIGRRIEQVEKITQRVVT